MKIGLTYLPRHYIRADRKPQKAYSSKLSSERVKSQNTVRGP